jgi:DNA-binding CsgD family transcriptional regulator
VAGKAKQNGSALRELHLTPTESHVLTLLATHLTLAAIGDQLGSRRSTVKTHVAHIYEKLGVRSRAGAVERASELGLLESADLSGFATKRVTEPAPRSTAT